MLDDIDEDDDYYQNQQFESRAEVERRLAMEKLEEKAFETVRLDTIE